MPLPKRNPPHEGACEGREEVHVASLRGRTNYSKLRKAVQPFANMEYSKEIYRERDDVDNWFACFGLLCLSKAEYFVLRFIIARTVNYGKACEIITKSQFLHGVQAGGEWKAAPCGVNSRDLYTALDSLCLKGMVQRTELKVKTSHAGTLYSVNISQIVNYRSENCMSSKLKMPKNKPLRVVPNGTTTPLEHGAKWHHRIVDNIKTNSSDVSQPSSARKSRVRKPVFASDCKPEEVIAKTLDRITERRESKVRRGRAAAPQLISLADLNATWKKCMADHGGFRNIVGLTGREYAIFKNTVKGHVLDFAWEDFFDWAIHSWGSVNARHSNYLKSQKEKGHEWSMNDQEKVYLGTKVPDLSALLRRLTTMIKRYVETKENVSLPVVDLDRVRKLEEELAKEKRISKAATSYADSVRKASSVAPVPTPKSKVTILDPARDTLDYDDLEDWPVEA